MKRKDFSIMLIFAIVMALTACWFDRFTKLLTKEGSNPTGIRSEKYILQSFGMEHNAQIISFHAQKP